MSIRFAQLGGVFDNFYVSMVRGGEMTGRLDEVFLRLFKHIEFESFMHLQVKAAVRYPGFVIGAMAIAVGVINTLVVPAFANVFKSFNAELPLATRILVTSSELTLQFGWLMGLGAAASAMSVNYGGCAVTQQVVTAHKCVKVSSCSDVTSVLQGGIPAGNTVDATALATNGVEGTCTFTQTDGTATKTFVGISAGN